MGHSSMKIILSNLVKSQLQDIYAYYNEKGQSKYARTIRANIIKKILPLSAMPRLGRIAENISGDIEYRFLIEKNYKIFYRIETNAIRISYIFDTRQAPDKLSSQFSE